MTKPIHPDSGQPFTHPDLPATLRGVVGWCGHRVAESEWRAGFRVCERDDEDDFDPAALDLSGLGKAQLMALRSRMMRERGSVQVSGGPVTAADYRDSILCMQRESAVRVGHFAEAGEGHERCGLMNFAPICGWVAEAAEVTA